MSVWGCLPRGCLPRGWCLSGGCLPGGVCQGGVCLGGVVAAQGVVYPGGVSARQTGVKTLPCRNYGAGGNKIPLELGLCTPIFKTFFSASKRFPKCLEFFCSTPKAVNKIIKTHVV